MDKRRKMFLSGSSIIKRFTKNVIVKKFGVTDEEFDKLIADGFIVEDNNTVCVNCHRTWNNKEEDCACCGEDEWVKERGYFRYD